MRSWRAERLGVALSELREGLRAVRTQACEPQGSTLQLLTVFWGSISGLLMWPVTVS